MFFGPLTNPKNKHLPDLTVRETLALAPLVVDDLRHRPLPLDLPRSDEGGVQLAYNQFKTVSGQAILFADDRDAKILPPRSSRRRS